MNKLLDKVFRGIDIFTGILTGAMVLFVFLNVVLRMVFNSGLTWSEELARYLFVAVTYIGAISAMRANAHMTVDMVLSKVKAPLQMTFYVISQSLIAVLMMMLVHGSYKMVLQNTAARTAALGIPYALLYSLGILTGVAICVLAVANIFYAAEISKIVTVSTEDEELLAEAASAGDMSDEEYRTMLNDTEKGGNNA
jgi:TRAP-type C4-dicarboxylate transport system permease small subunit